MRTIAALCVSGRSIYKHLPGVDAFDRKRDARNFNGGMPVVAHPPCRLWSKFLSGQAKAPDPEAEKRLGLWCVDQVLAHGGVLEHPAHSGLFAAANLPVPNQPAHPFLFTLYVEQSWFGYGTRKPTWVLVSGVPMHQVPQLPFQFGANAKPIEGMSQFARSRTVETFAEWLCQIARCSWFSLPEKTEGEDSGRFQNRSSNRILDRRFLPNRPDYAKSLALTQEAVCV